MDHLSRRYIPFPNLLLFFVFVSRKKQKSFSENIVQYSFFLNKELHRTAKQLGEKTKIDYSATLEQKKKKVHEKMVNRSRKISSKTCNN